MPKRAQYTPDPDLLAQFPDVSGNSINGLGETTPRAPSPFFWHPAEDHPHGPLQRYIVTQLRPASGEDRSFRNPAVDRGPDPVAVAAEKTKGDSSTFTAAVKGFAIENESDLVGITAMQAEYVYDGYSIEHPNVIILGFGHRYEELVKAPASDEDMAPYNDLHRQYNRGARAANKLTNFIRELGYDAYAYPGPMADALSMMPAAIAAGMGELGKHGSLINRQFGSAFRLSAVTTDLPLDYDEADVFGADDFCLKCQVCRNACPPDAIYDEKQPVRGVEKWYVDFDKCIPYFGENYACGICIAVCPWSRPGIAENLIVKMARRKKRLARRESP